MHNRKRNRNLFCFPLYFLFLVAFFFYELWDEVRLPISVSEFYLYSSFSCKQLNRNYSTQRIVESSSGSWEMKLMIYFLLKTRLITYYFATLPSLMCFEWLFYMVVLYIKRISNWNTAFSLPILIFLYWQKVIYMIINKMPHIYESRICGWPSRSPVDYHI